MALKKHINTYLILFFLLGGFYGFSQCPPVIPDKEYRKVFNHAFRNFENNRFEEALPDFKSLLAKDPDNANLNFLVGYSYLNIDEIRELAKPYLEKASGNTTLDYSFDAKERSAPIFAVYYLAQVFYNETKFEEALKYYNEFRVMLPSTSEDLISEVEQKIQACYGNILSQDHVRNADIPLTGGL